MRIGILQTGIAPDSLKADFGDYPAFFETLLAGNGFEFTTYVVVNNDFPPGVQAGGGWLMDAGCRLDMAAAAESWLRSAC